MTTTDLRESIIYDLARLSLEVEKLPVSNEKTALLEDLKNKFSEALETFGPGLREDVLKQIETLRAGRDRQDQRAKQDQDLRNQKVVDSRKKAEGWWSQRKSHKVDSWIEDPKHTDFIGSHQIGLVIKSEFLIYDLGESKIIRRLKLPGLNDHDTVRVSRDGQTAWVMTSDLAREYHVYRIDIKTMKKTVAYDGRAPLREIFVSPNEKYLAITTEETVTLVDTVSLKKVYEMNLDNHVDGWKSSQFSPESQYFSSRDGQGHLAVLNLANGQNINIKNPNKLRYEVFVPGQDAMIGIRNRGLVRINLQDGSSSLIKTPYITDGPLRISKDGSRLLILDEADSSAHLFDLKNGVDVSNELPTRGRPRLYAETRDSSYLLLQDGANTQDPHLVALDAADFKPTAVFMNQVENTAIADRLITPDRSGIIHFHHPGAFEFTE